MVLALSLSGCALAARDHPCWPYVEHLFAGDVPSDVVKQLAHEHGVKREVQGHRAPTGSYWQPRKIAGRSSDPLAGWQLARCPAPSAPPRPKVQGEEEEPAGPRRPQAPPPRASPGEGS